MVTELEDKLETLKLREKTVGRQGRKDNEEAAGNADLITGSHAGARTAGVRHLRRLTDEELDKVSEVAVEAAENYILSRVSKKRSWTWI